MKRIIYGLIVSLLFSCNISFSRESNIPAIRDFITNVLVFFIVAEVAWKITPYVWEKCKNIFSYLSTLFMNEKTQNNDNHPESNTTSQNKKNFIPVSVNIHTLTPAILAALTKKRREEEAEKIKEGTELHQACDANDVKKVELLLLQNEIDINALRNTIEFDRYYNIQHVQGGTALHIACKNKNQNIINLLLAHPDIDVSLEDNKGYTPLYFIVLHNDQDLIDRLLDRKTTEFTDCRALRKACEKGYVDIVSKLLARSVGKCMHIDADKCWNPLLTTCRKIECCENKIIVLVKMRVAFLRTENIDIDDMSNNRCYCPIKDQKADQLLKEKNPQNIQEMINKIQYKRDRLINVVKVLLEPQYISFVVTDCKKIAFYAAVSNAKLLKLLWEKNISLPKEKQCSIDAQSTARRTALYCAAEVGNKESFFFLLEHGANLSIKEYSPLILLCKNAAREIRKNPVETRYKDIIIQLFSDHKTIVTAQALDVSNSLLETVNNGAVSGDYLLQLLLDHGANPNKKNEWNWSPVLRAAASHDLSLLNLFIDKYNGDIGQQHDCYGTVFYIAFMHNKIQKPDEINYFNNLNAQQKEKFIKKELTVLVNKAPRYPFLNISDMRVLKDDYFARDIKRFNLFVGTCMNYLYDKKSVAENLLNMAREKAQERYNNFFVHKCMYSNSKKCSEKCRDSEYDYKCAHYFKYNELIIHTLVRHTDANDVDQQIAKIFAEKPIEYYSLSQDKKEEHKITLQKLLDSGQLCRA